MPINTDTEGRFSGEGWVTGGFMGPVWMNPAGWVWFPEERSWRFMPFMLSGGPTWDTWQAAGMPVFSPEPTGPPQMTPLPGAEAPAPVSAYAEHSVPLGTSALIRASDGRYQGEGWFDDEDPPVYLRHDGWVWFSQYGHWQYVPFVHANGPTQEEWVAAGSPILGSPPADPPPGYVPAHQPLAESAPPIPLPPSQPAGEPAQHAPTSHPFAGSPPGLWDGVGWVQHEGDLVYKRGDGWYFSQTRNEWKEATHLLTGSLPAPPPPPMGMRVQKEMQNLRTGWPTPKQAWKSPDKFVRVCRWIMLLGPAIAVLGLAGGANEGSVIVAFFGFMALPIAAFYGYLRVVYKQDRKKALALFIGASMLQGLFGRAVNGHIARTQPTPMGMDTDPYRLNRVMRP